jgi:putative membrane protein
MEQLREWIRFQTAAPAERSNRRQLHRKQSSMNHAGTKILGPPRRPDCLFPELPSAGSYLFVGAIHVASGNDRAPWNGVSRGLGTIGKSPCSASNRMEALMKTTIFALALASAFTATAFAQSVGEKTGLNSALGITPKTEDFIKEAATSDMLEIEAAKVAQQKGNAEEKKFAEQMMTDHTKTSSELKGMVPTELTPAIPTSLDDSSQKKLDKLRNAKPEDFSSDYDPMQVNAHEDAVSLFERYAKGGDNARLKDWAGKTLPALQHHLQMAEQLEKNRK